MWGKKNRKVPTNKPISGGPPPPPLLLAVAHVCYLHVSIVRQTD